MLSCKFCSKLCTNKNSLSNHERLCTENKDRKYVSNKLGKPGGNQYTKGTATPLSAETRKKLSEASKKQVWSADRRQKHSISMKKAVLNNPESYTSKNVCGRVKIEDYNGEKFHGKWELDTAKWLDSFNIKWERKVQPFNYFWNNTWHLYFPDFYLPELKCFLEIKGYTTDRDICKWSAVPSLVVFKKLEIQLIKKDPHALVTHLVESARLITEEAGFESLTGHQILD